MWALIALSLLACVVKIVGDAFGLGWTERVQWFYLPPLMVALVATYVALVIGRHGAWMPLEVRMWAMAYPLYLFAVVRPITSMWRFLLLDFPLAALVASVAMRTSTGREVVRHWRLRVAVVAVCLVGGILAWSCGLLPYVPWHVTPP